jgi:hypothetical protein
LESLHYATHMWQPHDSSELNGSFKIQLYKSKETYLREKPCSRTKFVSTDVIPILNRTWPSTLGNREFAKKALVDSGWFVLNYMLLDDKQLQTNEPDNHLQHETDINLDLNTINTSRSGFSYTLDKIIDDRLKSAGRKRRYDEIRASTATKEQKIEQLEKMLNVSSGKLASNNIFVLDESVRAKMLQNETQKQIKACETKRKKAIQQQKENVVPSVTLQSNTSETSP